MRVLHLLASNRYSGAENVACQIIGACKDNITFAYTSPNGSIADSLKDKGVDFYPMSKLSCKELKRVIKEYKPTIIHAHDMRAITLASVASGEIPVVAHIHLNHPNFRKLSIRSLIFRFIANLKKVKKIVWVSNSCLQDYKFNKCKAVQTKSMVLNNIINTETFKQKAEMADIQTGSELVYLGRLTFQKNPERLVSIVKLLQKDIPNIKLSVIGNGDMQEQVEALAKQSGVENNIKFYGFMSNGYGILKNSKVFLLTSRYEGYPMCVLEAQALGLPIVSTNLGELNNLVIDGKTGLIYDTDEQACERIKKLLLDDDCYSKMQQNVLQLSKEYNDLEKYKNTMMQIYKS